jgi:hypothetical protein
MGSFSLSGSSLRDLPAAVRITPRAIAVVYGTNPSFRIVVPALDRVWKVSPNVL